MTNWTNQWSPWTEMNRLQGELNRLFGRGQASSRTSRRPAVNVWEGDGRLVLTAELPGVDPDDIDVTVNRNSVALRGKATDVELPDGQEWHRRERSADAFDRTIELPFEVDPDKTEAAFEKGVLTLELHRPEEHKPKKVQIKSK